MSNSNGPTTKTLIIVALFGAAVVASLAAYVKLTPADRVPAEQRRVEATVAKPHAAPDVNVSVHQAKVGEVYVYLPYFEGETLKFRSRISTVPKGVTAEAHSVQEFLTDTKIADANARVLGVDVKEGLASVSFNSAFGPGYGAEDEHVLVEGLRRELGQFPAVEKFELYIDGTKVETLGNIDLSAPVDVIRTTTTDEAPTPSAQG